MIERLMRLRSAVQEDQQRLLQLAGELDRVVRFRSQPSFETVQLWLQTLDAFEEIFDMTLEELDHDIELLERP